jgi:hypothetical protein
MEVLVLGPYVLWKNGEFFHKAELLDDWSLAQARQPLVKIEPLE